MVENVYPIQVILISTRGTTELLGKEVTKDNMMTAAWHCPLSFEPPLYGISIAKTRFTYKLIKDSKVFCVNFLPYELKEKAVYCGTASGASTDKFEKTGLTKEECESIDCCKVGDAAAQLECEVVDEFEVGDHVFFVGKVLRNIDKNDKKRLLYNEDDKFTSTLS
ncbi:flavin reductase family protein [Candidatus Woesearchaeota archaeon]|jgi:flavin reductase (DIM6/NTAB) family NADH-FMN oxidoreductase RutF|nr:flavin reductase family protein [Candidatus Woesearchaeota archaeon]